MDRTTSKHVQTQLRACMGFPGKPNTDRKQANGSGTIHGRAQNFRGTGIQIFFCLKKGEDFFNPSEKIPGHSVSH